MSVDRSMNGLDALYREVILDHHRAPRNFGALANAGGHTEGFNPLCGDRVEIFVNLKDDKVEQCQFTGEGCSICMASASMMTEELLGKTTLEAEALVDGFRKLLRGEQCPLSVEGDLESLVGVRQFPVRIKCALLPWTSFSDALSKSKVVAPAAVNAEVLKEWLRTVIDPDLGLSLLELGLIYGVVPKPLDDGKLKVDVEMTLTSPMCPSAGYLQTQVEQRLKEHEAVKEVSVNIVFEPKWDPHTMASDEVKDRLGLW